MTTEEDERWRERSRLEELCPSSSSSTAAAAADTGGGTAAPALSSPDRCGVGRSSVPESSDHLQLWRLELRHRRAAGESVNASHLNPYLESLGADFTNGANFAVSGSATLPKTVPFSLFIQVLQFLRFRSRSLQLIAKGSKNLITEEGFRNALYTIDIGQNDIYLAFFANSSYAQVMDKIPLVLTEIKGAIKMIHDWGGRNFWIHGTGPLGCLPQAHTIYWNGSSPLDDFGCLKSFNRAAKAFNNGLRSLCDELRSELEDSTVVYTDMYAIKYGLIANYSKHNFQNPMETCMTCGCQTCGDACQSCMCQTCSEGPRYISWDGVHYSEAANAILASEILSTKYSRPRVKFDMFCTV